MVTPILLKYLLISYLILIILLLSLYVLSRNSYKILSFNRSDPWIEPLVVVGISGSWMLSDISICIDCEDKFQSHQIKAAADINRAT